MEVKAESIVSPASQKKLKQSRLPFQILSPSTPKCELAAKKRKLSASSDSEPSNPAKVQVVETKENLAESEKAEEVAAISLLEDEDEKDEEEKRDLIKIKLPFALTQKKKVSQEKKAKKTSKTKSKEPKSPAKDVEEDVVLISDSPVPEDPAPVDKSLLSDDVMEESSMSKSSSPEKASSSPPKSRRVSEEPSFKGFEEQPSFKGLEREAGTSSESSPEKAQEEAPQATDEQKKVPDTPKQAKNAVSTPRSSSKKLSEAEKAAREKQREEQKQERLRKLEEEKQARAKEREEKRLKEKAEREAVKQKEREEKEAQKAKEKAEREEKLKKERDEKEALKREKERKKQEEIDLKNEEKRQKEEEQQKKHQKSIAIFQKFFVKKPAPSEEKRSSEDDASKESVDVVKFIPFQVKGNMKLAPIVRHSLDEGQKEALEGFLKGSGGSETDLYLAQVKKAGFKARTSASTWPQQDDDVEEIEVIGTEGEQIGHESLSGRRKKWYRVKFLRFADNRRPPYYGTWRKKSKTVTPRRPFATDTIFDYEVDSDLEWEEEGEGESLNGSDDEKDKDADDEDYEVDNDFFVPHGHLSDEEMDAEDEENNSPEAQKAKLKVMQLEFAEQMKKRTEKLQPRLIGCIWMKNGEKTPSSNCSPIAWGILKTRAMLFNPDKKITIDWEDDAETEEVVATPAQKKVKLTEADLPDLIRLVHGNRHSRKFLVDEFTSFKRKQLGDESVELTQVGSKIKEIADYRQFTEDEGPSKYSGWFVKPEMLEKYNLTDITLPNSWTYSLEPTRTAESVNLPSSVVKKIVKIDEESMPDLIRLVHGNQKGKKFLVQEFAAYRKAKFGDREDFQEFHCIGSKIKSIAEWCQFQEQGHPMHGKMGWWVSPEVLKRYGLEDLPLPNAWSYTLEAPKKLKAKPVEVKPAEETSTKQQPGAGNIEKFAKILSVDERKRQFEAKVSDEGAPPPKKRVALLMSVPVGEAIPEAKKNSLISQFLMSKKAESDTKKSESEAQKVETETQKVETETQKPESGAQETESENAQADDEPVKINWDSPDKEKPSPMEEEEEDVIVLD